MNVKWWQSEQEEHVEEETNERMASEGQNHTAERIVSEGVKEPGGR